MISPSFPHDPMLIEQIWPNVVGKKATLERRLVIEAIERGLTSQEIKLVISQIPIRFLNVNCFFDRFTEMWRYEFGLPFEVTNKDYLWGTHMWPPVKYLFIVVHCAIRRLAARQQRSYFTKLLNPEKHWDTLVEFIPIIRLPEDTDVTFEVPTGVGNHNADWSISTSTGRTVLIDVKRRFRDLLEFVDKLEMGERYPDGTAPAPTHDVSILFRSTEEKYARNDPSKQLQGVWIDTALKQEENELNIAFNALDGARVHFAILGDWEPGIKLLTKRDEDQQFLLCLFSESVTDRYHFTRL